MSKIAKSRVMSALRQLYPISWSAFEKLHFIMSKIAKEKNIVITTAKQAKRDSKS
jgi:hypothetical protein